MGLSDYYVGQLGREKTDEPSGSDQGKAVFMSHWTTLFSANTTMPIRS